MFQNFLFANVLFCQNSQITAIDFGLEHSGLACIELHMRLRLYFGEEFPDLILGLSIVLHLFLDLIEDIHQVCGLISHVTDMGWAFHSGIDVSRS